MRLRSALVIKWITVCILSAAIGFACAWYIIPHASGEAVPAGSVAVSSQVLTAQQFRTERQQLRAMQKAQLNDIIFGGTNDSSTVSAAREQLMDILKREEMENTLEGLLEMRGFRDVVVSIHRDSASVFVSKDMVTQQESAVILDLVCRETGFLGGNIKIIPIN